MTKRKQGGQPTSDLVLSAFVGDNSDLFPKIAGLYLPRGCKVADVTYGKGVFWSKIERGTYELHSSDIDPAERPEADECPLWLHRPGVDCRALPYDDASFDALVLDPPYMEGFFRAAKGQRAGSGTHVTFQDYYAHDGTHESGPGEPKWHDVVFELYRRAGLEARRVLRPGGKLLVKTQDEVSSNTQRLTHIEIVTAFEAMGFYTKDLFILVRTNKPGVSRMKKQEHARKNHSYFLVFELPKGRRKRPRSNPG
jgi:hypothetical protein